MKWFELSGRDTDVVISTRVRLARNLTKFPFPRKLDSDKAAQIVELVTEAAAPARLNSVDFDTLDMNSRLEYVEKHIVSPDFASGDLPRRLLVNDEESLSVMINEEDHLRIQAMGSGLCLEDCMTSALRLDTLLDSSLSFAFDTERGYLITCPTNLGCAMRLSVMLHLPAIIETGYIKSLVSALSKLGLTVRGMYGEGSGITGYVYQISNALSLGYTEAELLERLTSAVQNIITTERELRKASCEREETEDRIWRAYGLLTNARSMSSGEAMKLLGELKLAAGTESDKLPIVDDRIINSLLTKISPNLVGEEDASKRDRRRAELIRSYITSVGEE